MNIDDTMNVVNGFFALLQSGAAPEEIASVFADHVDWDIPGATGIVPWVGKRETSSQVADFYHTLSAHTQLRCFDINVVIPSEATVVVLGYFESLVVKSQKMIKSEFVMHMRVAEGKIDMYRFFEDSYAVSQAMN